MKNLSLKTKLYALSGFLLAVSITLGGIGYWSTKTVVHEYSEIAEVNYPNTSALLQMIMAIRQARVELVSTEVTGTTADMDLNSFINIAEQWSTFDSLRESYEKVPFMPGEKELFEDFKATAAKQRELFAKAVTAYKASGGVETTPEYQEFSRLLREDIAGTAEDLRVKGSKLREFHLEAAKQSSEGAKAAADMGMMISLLTLAVGFLTGTAFAYIFSTNLVKVLGKITASIADSSNQVSSAAGQIASSSQQLSQAATEQASSLEETAASIEELNSMVTKNRDNAKETSTVSTESETTASKGRETVDQMIESMNEINRSNEQIGEIVKVINEIGNKTKVINDIVFQTKLLSFNASVEAARAGEHGKGFAVVAEEVGNLAQMSGNAAKEISSLLESSIQKVEAIVHDTKAKVEAGTLTAQQCGEILSEIVTNVSKVAGMASEISTASEEQSRGVQEITKAMNQLDQVTQTNAATSEEAASAAEELSAQSDALRGLVEELTFTVNGRSGSAPAPVAAAVKAVPATRAPAKGGKIVHLKGKASKAVHPAPAFKKAAGDDSVPSYDDDRFNDV